MQIKTTMRYHFKLPRMAIIQKEDNNKLWAGAAEIRILRLCRWEAEKGRSHWKIVYSFSKS
jgi:hypothetical protein